MKRQQSSNNTISKASFTGFPLIAHKEVADQLIIRPPNQPVTRNQPGTSFKIRNAQSFKA